MKITADISTPICPIVKDRVLVRRNSDGRLGYIVQITGYNYVSFFDNTDPNNPWYYPYEPSKFSTLPAGTTVTLTQEA